jgi:hypothetical protein
MRFVEGKEEEERSEPCLTIPHLLQIENEK